MESQDLKTFLRGRAEMILKGFECDFAALDHDQLLSSFAGKARTPYDLAYEVAKVNRRIAVRMSGGDPGPWEPTEGWTVAPAEMNDKAHMQSELATTAAELLAAWDRVPEGELHRTIPLPNGSTSPIDLMFMSCFHTSYHAGQLNYVQTLYGDDQMHWSDD
jgi:hypothetical protein